MRATVYRIADRTQTFPAEVRHPGQFELEEPSQTGAEIVLGDTWSLYCLDVPGNRALFVELPEDTDLSDAPFVFGAQFEKAFRAASIPLDLLPELAKEVPEPAKTGGRSKG